MAALSSTAHRPDIAREGPSLLWINQFAIAPDMGGGTRHIEMARELIALGWHVSIAASDFHVHQRAYARRRDASDRRTIRELIDGVEWRWLWASAYATNDLRRVRNWITFARSVLGEGLADQRPGLIIGSTPQLLAAWAGYRLARRLRRPFVLEVRDLWPETLAVSGRRRGPGYAGLWALARHLYARADRIVVLADGVSSYLERIGVPARRIIRVPNGVALDAFAGIEPPERDTLRLVYAGAHGPANGLDRVLDAAEVLLAEPRISFLLVGDGPSKASLQADAARRGLSNVTFAPSVSKSAVPELLGSCDAGLMVLKDVPLFSFGVSPNKLFDYWAAALPVVCNVSGEVAHLVAQAAGGVQAADASGAALAEAIRSLLARMPSERRALGRNGRAWVASERDRPRLASRLDAALGQLCPLPR